MKEGEDYTFITVGEGGMAVAGFMQKSIDAYASDTAGVATLQLRGVDLRDPHTAGIPGILRQRLCRYARVSGGQQRRARGAARPRAGQGRGIEPANREAATLEHAKLGNPQQLEDMEFANALLDVYLDLLHGADRSRQGLWLPGSGIVGALAEDARCLRRSGRTAARKTT